MLFKLRLFALICGAVAGFCSMCVADTAEDGRKLADTYKDAIVTVKLVLEANTSYEGSTEKEEHKVSATGTVIDASGLTVASLTEIDPTASMPSMDSEDGFSMSVNVTDCKLKMSDGAEIAADVVLRDRDLDLAFIKPKTPLDKPAVFIDLTQASTPQLLDEITIVTRLGQVANRAIAANVERIRAMVTKPRTFYVLTGISGLGCPAFTSDGKIAGVVVVRANRGDNDEGSSMSYRDAICIILPSSTIAKTAEQAKEATPVAAELKPAEKEVAPPSKEAATKAKETKPSTKKTAPAAK